MIRIIFTILVFGFSLILAIPGFACPKIDGIIDANCDGKIQIAVFGDSIVRGVRDTNLDSETGGYLKDLSAKYPNVTFVNGGIPGIDSGALYRAFVRAVPNKGKTYQAVTESDAILTGVGINDYWLHVPPQQTIRNLFRIRDFLRSYAKKEVKISPITLTINLTNTTRGFQEPWVRSVNSLIRANTSRLGPIVPFGDIPGRLIVSYDRLHPDDAGYARLAAVMSYSLRHSYNPLAKKRNVDLDKDGVADWAETRLYQTNPTLVDTDGDSLADGDEIFKYKTNPLLVDSDADGIDDATEIASGSDPNLMMTPTVTPTVSPS